MIEIDLFVMVSNKSPNLRIGVIKQIFQAEKKTTSVKEHLNNKNSRYAIEKWQLYKQRSNMPSKLLKYAFFNELVTDRLSLEEKSISEHGITYYGKEHEAWYTRGLKVEGKMLQKG